MCCCTINSFCCMRLPTAGVVIGWLSSVLSLIQTVICIVILATLDTILKHILFDHMRTIDYSATQAITTGISILVSVQLIISILDVIASVLLIVGSKKYSHLMLLPWLVNNVISLVFRSLFALGFVCSAFRNKGLAWIVIIYFIGLGIHYWVCTAIFSLFRSIRDSKDQALDCEQQNAKSSNYELFHNSNDVTENRY